MTLFSNFLALVKSNENFKNRAFLQIPTITEHFTITE